MLGCFFPAFAEDKSNAGWWKSDCEATMPAAAALSSLLLCFALFLYDLPVGSGVLRQSSSSSKPVQGLALLRLGAGQPWGRYI